MSGTYRDKRKAWKKKGARSKAQHKARVKRAARVKANQEKGREA